VKASAPDPVRASASARAWDREREWAPDPASGWELARDPVWARGSARGGAGSGAGVGCPGAGSGLGAMVGRLSPHAMVSTTERSDAMMTGVLDCMAGLPLSCPQPIADRIIAIRRRLRAGESRREVCDQRTTGTRRLALRESVAVRCALFAVRGIAEREIAGSRDRRNARVGEANRSWRRRNADRVRGLQRCVHA
jgi:hypothetical protein